MRTFYVKTSAHVPPSFKNITGDVPPWQSSTDAVNVLVEWSVAPLMDPDQLRPLWLQISPSRSLLSAITDAHLLSPAGPEV